ncbi:MAG: hypothetical protein EPN21_03840 [Methylococcaceae bacterium]|nr:MAG: hypothetical protein EPN21_03840 [Methylococcaceae bacterium]
MMQTYPIKPAAIAELAKQAYDQNDFSGSAKHWQSLISHFPKSTQPSWFLGNAKALQAATQIDAAIATLEHGAALHPTATTISALLARLLYQTGVLDQAIARLRHNWTYFQEHRKPNWLNMLHGALKRTGKHEEAAVVLELMQKTYPGDIQTLLLQAREAQSAGKFEQSLAAWEQCINSFPDEIEPDWLLGKAKCLLSMWRTDEGRKELLLLQEKHPNFRGARIALRDLAELACDWENALIHSESATGTSEEQLDDLVFKGRMLAKLSRYEQAAELAGQIEDIAQESPAAYLLRHFILAEQTKSIEAEKLVIQALEQFPQNEKLSDIRFDQLFLTFALDEAQEFAESYRKEPLPLQKWKLIGAKQGRDALIQALIRDWSNPHGSTSKDRKQLINSLCTWVITGNKSFMADRREDFAIPFALQLLTPTINASPFDATSLTNYIHCLIALGYNDAAIQLIERLPMEMACKTRVGQLIAWSHAMRGDWQSAMDVYTRVIEKNTLPSLHGKINQLVIDERSPLRQCHPGVIAFVPVRDELHNLTDFFKHHRKLGIATFVVIDNGSIDGTLDFLRDQPDVLLYVTDDNFGDSSGGMLWINTLMSRYGQHDWRIFLDADEKFIYPDWERRDINSLCHAMEEEGAEGMFAFMLDVYPDRFDPAETDYAKIRESCTYFDNNYRWSGLVTPPYTNVQGGVRQRLYEDAEWLPKLPLTKGGSTRYLTHHHTLPIRISRTSGLLVHYKLADLWRKGQSTATEDSQYMDRHRSCIGRYNRYFSKHEKLSAHSLLLDGVSIKMGDSRELVKLGLMRQATDTSKPDSLNSSDNSRSVTGKCARYPVVARFRQRDIDPSGPYSLVRGKRAEIHPAQAENTLLYCADPLAGTVLYTEHENLAALFRRPFLYMAQFDMANAVIEVPYSALHEINKGLTANPTFIFSIGRCGSTALSKAFAQAGISSVSEPDLPTQIAIQRARIAASFGDTGISGLLQAMSRNLAAHLGLEFAVKLRAQCNSIVDDILDAHQTMKCIFMLRRGDSWAISMHRAFGTPGPRLALLLRNGILAYHRLVTRGAQPSLVWFEDLQSDLGNALGNLSLPLPAAPGTGPQDAQEGTSLARNQLSEKDSEGEVIQAFLATWENIRPDCLDAYPDIRQRLGV